MAWKIDGPPSHSHALTQVDSGGGKGEEGGQTRTQGKQQLNQQTPSWPGTLLNHAFHGPISKYMQSQTQPKNL